MKFKNILYSFFLLSTIFILFIYPTALNAVKGGVLTLRNGEVIEFDSIDSLTDSGDYFIFTDESAEMPKATSTRIDLKLANIKKISFGNFFKGKKYSVETHNCEWVKVKVLLITNQIVNLYMTTVEDPYCSAGPTKLKISGSDIEREIDFKAIKEIKFNN
jgi:hypothetical protein